MGFYLKEEEEPLVVWAICENKPECKWTGPLENCGETVDGKPSCPVCYCPKITTWT